MKTKSNAVILGHSLQVKLTLGLEIFVELFLSNHRIEPAKTKTVTNKQINVEQQLVFQKQTIT